MADRAAPSVEVLAEIDAHVEAILSRAGVPVRDRADVREELTGHLVERWQDAVASGIGADRAVAQTLLDFGDGRTIGPAFVRAYHSALWATTIGALLPIAAGTGSPPGSIRWAILFDRFMAVFSVIAGCALLATWTPLRAVLGGVLVLGGALVLWLAAEALQRNQRWGYRATVFGLLVNVVILVVSLFPQGGGFNLSLNGLAGLIIVVALLGDSTRVDGWLRSSASLPSRTGAVVGAALVAWAVSPVVVERMPDPSQIGPSDLSVVASMTCPGSFPGGGVADIALDVTPHRVDAWPLGIVKGGDTWGDAVDVRFADNSTVVGDRRIVDLSTGREVEMGWGELVHPGIDPDHNVAGIGGQTLVAGRTLRLTIEAFGQTATAGDAEPIPIEARVAYGHIDRFLLVGNLACGESTALHERGVAD